MASAPCKNCEKKFIGCHSSCDEYLAYVDANEAEKETMRKTREKLKHKTYMPASEFCKAINRKVENKVFKQHKK